MSNSLFFSTLINGANEHEKKNIRNYIEIPDDKTEEEINEYCGKVISEINKCNDNEIKISTKLWVKSESRFYKSFLSALEFYETKIKGIDFLSNENRSAINEEIGELSGYYDANISISTPNDISSILISATYFKKEWDFYFSDVEEGTFMCTIFRDGMWQARGTKCEMLSTLDYFNYMQSSDFSMLELPYKGNTYSMLIILPNSNGKWDQILPNIQKEGLAACIQKMRSTKIDFKMPKFSICNVIDPMKNGIGQDDLLSYSAASPDTKFLNKYYQVCKIKVDEKGTWVETNSGDAPSIIPQTGLSPIHTIDFHVNRLFFFLIKINTHNTILYAGCVKTME